MGAANTHFDQHLWLAGHHSQCACQPPLWKLFTLNRSLSASEDFHGMKSTCEFSGQGSVLGKTLVLSHACTVCLVLLDDSSSLECDIQIVLQNCTGSLDNHRVQQLYWHASMCFWSQLTPIQLNACVKSGLLHSTCIEHLQMPFVKYCV